MLPEFATADPEATKTITIRQLLSHTGGADLRLQPRHRPRRRLPGQVRRGRQGRARWTARPGRRISYGSVGYVVLGRIIEVLTGQTWDQALKDRLLTPLGLEHSMTLPEEALRFRVAMGHLGEPGSRPGPGARPGT